MLVILKELVPAKEWVLIYKTPWLLLHVSRCFSPCGLFSSCIPHHLMPSAISWAKDIGILRDFQNHKRKGRKRGRKETIEKNPSFLYSLRYFVRAAENAPMYDLVVWGHLVGVNTLSYESRNLLCAVHLYLSPPKHYIETLILSMMIFVDGTLKGIRRRWGHDGGDPIMGLAAWLGEGRDEVRARSLSTCAGTMRRPSINHEASPCWKWGLWALWFGFYQLWEIKVCF